MEDPQQLVTSLERHLSLSDDPGFRAFMEAIQPLPNEELGQTIAQAMQKRHKDPPCSHLTACLSIPIGAEQARKILFYPAAQEMALYPKLLASNKGESQEKCLTHALTCLYLVHSHAWDRVKPFIEAGGCIQLMELMSHSNLYIASQAMQCFQTITDEEMYPWHDPPRQEGTLVAEDLLVWRRMLEVTQSGLIPALLRHQDTFPGSGLVALTIFAWVVSWVRYNFTKDRVLHLSPQLLHLLQEWSLRQSASESERALAKQLYEDFSRAAPATSAPIPQLGNSQADTTLPEDANLRIVHDHTQVNGYKPSEAETLKQLGNSAFKEADFSKAIKCYSRALDVPVPSAELLNEGPRRAVVLANRAQAYLSRAAAGGGMGSCDDEGLMEGIELGSPDALTKHYEAAHIDAQAAIDLDPTYIKAHQRKIQALWKLGKLQEALLAGSRAPKQHNKELDALLSTIQAELEKESKAPKPPSKKGPLISVISESPA